MSRATKRAQERRNRTPDEEVTDKTAFAQVAGFRTSVRLRTSEKVGFRTSEKGRTSDAGSNLLRRKCRKSENFRTSEMGVGWGRDLSPKLDFGRKISTWRTKLKGEKEKLGLRNANGGRSTSIASDPWIKTNKTTQNPTREQILGMAIFCGDFRIGEEQSKKRLESRGGRHSKSWQPCS